MQRIGREWSAGARLPTVPELAQLLGAGYTNTHRAMRQLASEGVLVSRPRRGTFVAKDYSGATRAASALAHRRIAVLIESEPIAPFAWAIVEPLQRALADAGAQSRIIDVRQRFGDAYFSIDRFDPYEADDFIAINPRSTRRQPMTVRDDQRLVVISTQRQLISDCDGRFDVVTVDEKQGAYLAGRAMRDAGCESVFFLGGGNIARGTHDVTSTERLAGFERGYGGEVDPSCRAVTGGYTESRGARAFAAYAAHRLRPQGVFAASDDLAFGFQYAALGAGLMPGEDFQLIGFDGQSRYIDRPDLKVSSVAVPCEAMALRAVELLSRRCADASLPVEQITFGCNFYRGDTTRAASTSDDSPENA